MQFAKHMTFYLRNGWISKALIALQDNPYIFSPKNIGDAIDALGIGRTMVVSLRYWLGVLDVAEESIENNQVKLNLTSLGFDILEYDRYLERKGSLWILHYKMATNEEKATTWYWFFNKFPIREFDEYDFYQGLKKYIQNNGGKNISDNSLKKDFQCLKNTYIYDYKADIEEIISCPMQELKLLVYSQGKRVYNKKRPNINEIPPQIFYYLILESLSDDTMDYFAHQVYVNDLKFKDKSVGKVLNLTLNDVYNLLYSIENIGYIKLHRRFGSNYISILEEDKHKVLKEYYRNYDLD